MGAAPSMAMCTMLYKPGFAEPLGQYCVGRPGKDLVIPSLELDPGRYLIVVLQDMDGHGGPPPLVQESISDTYTVLVESAAP
jgi:eukaryotic-like serine/threonine-protein kinase